MATPNTNTATTSVLDEATKKYNDAWANYHAAVEQSNRNAQQRAAAYNKEDYSFEKFMQGLEPEKPKTVIDPKKEKQRAMITNIADAISAVSGMIGAANGADVTPIAPLSAANQQRHDKLVAQRRAEQDYYNRALMQQQSHAMSMAEYYRKQKQQEDAQAAALDDDKVRQAKLALDEANDAYSRAYRTQRDAESDRQHRASEARQWAAQDLREQSEVDEYNRYEDKKWTKFPGGLNVANEDVDGFVNNVYDALKNDPQIMKEIAAEDRLIDIAERNQNHKNAQAAKRDIVERYLGSNNPDYTQIAVDAARNSGKIGTPNYRTYRAGVSNNATTQINKGAGKAEPKTEEAATVQEMQPLEKKAPVTKEGDYANQYNDWQPQFYTGDKKTTYPKAQPKSVKQESAKPKKKIPGF